MTDAATIRRSSPASAPDVRLRLLALGGGLTMFLVQPPADLWFLAWLAPLPWLAIVGRDPLAPAAAPRDEHRLVRPLGVSRHLPAAVHLAGAAARARPAMAAGRGGAARVDGV